MNAPKTNIAAELARASGVAVHDFGTPPRDEIAELEAMFRALFFPPLPPVSTCELLGVPRIARRPLPAPAPAFNVSYRRVGGLRFVKCGRLCVSFSVARPGSAFRSIKGSR